MLFDEVLTSIGDFGTYQRCLYLMLGLVGIPTGYQNMGITFYGADMDHWCHIPRLQNFSHTQQKQIAIPDDEDGSQEYSRCRRFDIDFNSLSDDELLAWNRSEFQGGTVGCDAGWTFDKSVFVSTVLNQMDLVCGRGHLVSIIQTIYMLGFLIGCVAFGQMSDRAGRKPAMMTSLVCEVVFALVAAFVNNYAGFVILRFLVGVSAAGAFTTIFVICMEIIGPSLRMTTGIMVQGWFALGFMILPGISYAVRDHFRVQIITSVSTVILCLLFFTVPESPRWLITKGRDKEATEILQKMALINGTTLPEDLHLEDNRPDRKESDSEPTAIDLLKTPNLRKITLNMWFAWLVVSLSYYALSLGVSLLGGSLFLNSFISGVIELPSYILVVLLLNRAGRKWPTVVTFIASAIACFICMGFIGNDGLRVVLTVFLMIGKFCISATFAILYVYAAELFPTEIRQVGVGSSSMFARLGGIIQPQLARLGDSWAPGPFLIYGVTSLIAGGFSFFLPETLGKKLPETIEEGEQFGRKIQPAEKSVEDGKVNEAFDGNGVIQKQE